MKSMKKCVVTKEKISKRIKRCSSAGMFYTSSAGAVTSLILMLALPFLFSLSGTANTYATTSTLNISVVDSVSLSILPTSTSGTFATSDTSTNNISVRTTNGTGYTLGIKAKTNNSNALINSSDSSKTIPSITTSISEATYSTNTAYNNTWGFRPSKLNSAANENYIQAPTSSSALTTLDQTSSANPSTTNNYNLAIGARINSSTTPGSYSNVFVITVTANPIPYTITYNKNTTDTVTNMPSNVSSQTYDETVTISNTVPARDGFNFKGWCTVQVADGGTCTSTTYNPDGEGTDLNWTLDQTTSSNSLTLYAMWEVGILYMQDVAQWKDTLTTVGEQVRVVDNRDNYEYWVAKQADGNIWMTQNLDLDIGGTGVATLTSENTDLNTSGSGIYSDGYQSSGGVITWTPDTTAVTSGRTISGTTVTGWTNDNNEPYSAEGGDTYYYTTGTTSDETAQTLEQCKASHTEGECKHYHAGNYYNWTAAIASNASNNISTNYDVAANSICPKGWKLPQGKSSTYGDAATWQFGNLWYTSGITTSVSGSKYANNDSFNNIRTSPLFFVRGGRIFASSYYDSGYEGFYWSSSVYNMSRTYYTDFRSSYIYYANDGYNRGIGLSVRCMVR